MLTHRTKITGIQAYQFHNRVGTDTRPEWVLKAAREGRIEFHERYPRGTGPGYLEVKSIHSLTFTVESGDWIVADKDGHLTACSNELFLSLYEPVT